MATQDFASSLPGNYYSKMQKERSIVNVTLSFSIGLFLHRIKRHCPRVSQSLRCITATVSLGFDKDGIDWASKCFSEAYSGDLHERNERAPPRSSLCQTANPSIVCPKEETTSPRILSSAI